MKRATKLGGRGRASKARYVLVVTSSRPWAIVAGRWVGREEARRMIADAVAGVEK